MGSYKKHPRCGTCVYRGSTDDPHSCDFVHFTGTTRTHFLGTGDALDPRNCTLYKKGDRLVKTPREIITKKFKDRDDTYYWVAKSAAAMFLAGATINEVAKELNLTVASAKRLRTAAMRGTER